MLQLDADERLDEPHAARELTHSETVDAWLLPLIDYYITPEDQLNDDFVQPGNVRQWYGPEVRWTLCLFRLMSSLYLSRGVVREPQGFASQRVAPSTTPTVEHYGKAVSILEWERKVDFYVSQYPAYRDKWMARRGAAVHDGVSDFGRPLVHRGEKSFDVRAAPRIYTYVVERGPRAIVKRLLYGKLGPSLWSVATERVNSEHEASGS
ncbi:MAG: hypothetical protein ABSB75_00775 [Candidatus Limnocylindrales bacterium]